jgi:hypothetical protein
MRRSMRGMWWTFCRHSQAVNAAIGSTPIRSQRDTCSFGLPDQRRPKLVASAMASVREVTPIFRKMFPTWNFTVFSLMLRAPAMDLFR